MSRRIVEIAGRRLSLSNLEKDLYPPHGFTKAHVLEYYLRIAEFIIPHLQDRALTLKRYPNGVKEPYFFEKRCPSHPDWVKTAEVHVEVGETITACLVNNLETLIWVANLASLELHVPLARAAFPENPDSMVFDLDPGEPANILDCARVALILRELLSRLNLASWVKTSGQKGLHVYVPLNRSETTFEDTKQFTKAVAVTMQRNYPELVTEKMAKEARKGKVFINWAQNDAKKTMVCIYSLRAREEPFVSFPLAWRELEDLAGRGDPERFKISPEEAMKRAETMGDMFREMLLMEQRLPYLDEARHSRTNPLTLNEYSSKRKFGETPEPQPTQHHQGEQLIFVVHKHAARALHYDLRLELEGVLKSWAVPRGPSLDPSVKRLAVMVEDHPFAYKDFEGVIPEGNYGAGSVIIWDRGTYHHPSTSDGRESKQLLLEGLRKGDLKFVLEGEKLHGEFALVKTRDEKSWLLMKKKDSFATKADILADNRSVASTLTLEEVFEAGQGKSSGRGKLERARQQEALESTELQEAPLSPMPHNVRPMLATLATKPFNHPDWLFEVKWDGYRAVAELRDGEVSLYSRNLIPLQRKFFPIVESLRKLPFEAVLDGEIVVVDDQGHPDFQMLQDYQESGRGHLLYYVFDLLHLQGHDLTGLPLRQRKEFLKRILPSDPRIRFSDHVKEDGTLFFKVVKEKGLEGIIAKHARSTYQAGKRSRQWLKLKSRLTQECVIAGFTAPRGGRMHFGTLILGVYDGDELVYIGHSGGGFSIKELETISAKLASLIQMECPFKTEPDTNAPATWVRPELVCEVALSGWTNEGLMRHPVFLRLREDKSVAEVVREVGCLTSG